MSKHRGRYDYEVIVGNIGTIYRGVSKKEALRRYSDYVKISLSNIGRAGGESVLLMKDGEPIREHQGTVEVY